MSLISGTRRTVTILVAALALCAVMAPTAGAATSTITRDDCLKGRISHQGKPVSTAECLRHVGQSVNLAHTGFDAWIVALAGGACLAGAAALRIRPRDRTTRA